MSLSALKHSECANFRDGICLVTGARVNPDGAACPNFVPESTLAYQQPATAQYGFMQQPVQPLDYIVPPYMLMPYSPCTPYIHPYYWLWPQNWAFPPYWPLMQYFSRYLWYCNNNPYGYVFYWHPIMYYYW